MLLIFYVSCAAMYPYCIVMYLHYSDWSSTNVSTILHLDASFRIPMFQDRKLNTRKTKTPIWASNTNVFYLFLHTIVTHFHVWWISQTFQVLHFEMLHAGRRRDIVCVTFRSSPPSPPFFWKFFSFFHCLHITILDRLWCHLVTLCKNNPETLDLCATPAHGLTTYLTFGNRAQKAKCYDQQSKTEATQKLNRDI